VPTGINTGVSIEPWDVCSNPARALVFFEVANTLKSNIIAKTQRLFSYVLIFRSTQPTKNKVSKMRISNVEQEMSNYEVFLLFRLAVSMLFTNIEIN